MNTIPRELYNFLRQRHDVDVEVWVDSEAIGPRKAILHVTRQRNGIVLFAGKIQMPRPLAGGSMTTAYYVSFRGWTHHVCLPIDPPIVVAPGFELGLCFYPLRITIRDDGADGALVVAASASAEGR